MSQANLPISFWGYALETAVFTLNRVPTKSVEKAPYEMWTGKCPGLSLLKVWGCEAYVKRLMSDKLTPKSDKSMHDNQVWNLVDQIDSVRPVDCKWIFKKKIRHEWKCSHL